MPIVIKKKVSLEFLGDEYKEAYLTFRAVPIAEYEEIDETIDKAVGLDKVKQVLAFLKTHFISGEFPNDKGVLEAVIVDDMDSVDGKVLYTCYRILLGTYDPKGTTPLTTS